MFCLYWLCRLTNLNFTQMKRILQPKSKNLKTVNFLYSSSGFKLRCLKKITLFLAMFFYVISVCSQIEKTKLIDSISFIEVKDTLELLYGRNKFISDDYELCFLIALSHYPELSDSKIIFKNSKIKTTLNARPTFLSTFFRRESKRTYVIRYNNSKNPNKIKINQADFNSKVGILGHELGHISDYSQASTLGVIKRGFSYLTKKSHKKYENKIDILTIQKGLGWQLYDWSYFALNNPWATEKYKKFKRKYYLTPEQIYEQMTMNDLKTLTK